MTILDPSPPERSRRALSQQNVSIIIPTARRPISLEECLKSLQRHAAGSEIIVVGEKDDELTRKLMKSYSLAEYLENEGFSRVVARNMGIARASRDILVFVDDDVVVEPGWLENLLSHYADDSVGGVGGRVRIQGLERDASPYKTGAIIDGFVIGNWDGANLRTVDVQHLPGSNMSFRKKLVLMAGGFDNFFRVFSFREDTDLCLRVSLLGYRLVFEPTASLVHKGLGRNNAGARWIFEYVRNTFYLYMRYERQSGGMLSFLRRLIFPPKDYAALAGVTVRINPISPLVAVCGLIGGFFGYVGHRDPQPILTSGVEEQG
jgi:GT2 family glycosyltransferase